MKKFVFLSSIAFATISLFFTSCKDEETGIDCAWEGIEVFTKEYGTDSAITIYPVITTNNYDFCDSMVWDTIAKDWVKPYDLDDSKLCTEEVALEYIRQGNDTACPCRENPNKHNDQVNSKFVIDGIEKFKYNNLHIKIPGDTIKIRRYVDYTNEGNVFQGYVSTDTSLGYYEFYNSRVLASGIYEYELILFKDPEHQVPFDTIANKFVIITSKYRDRNSNCKDKAKEKDDPLLK